MLPYPSSVLLYFQKRFYVEESIIIIMRKFLTTIFATLSVLPCACCLFACNGGDGDKKDDSTDGHNHSAWSYSVDGEKHWRACDECGATFDSGEHELDSNDVCTICGYSPVYTQGLSYKEGTDEYDNIIYAVIGIGDATDTDIIIPSYHNGRPVVGIGLHAFYGCSSLTSVTILNGVTYIQNHAFQNCSNLTSITIPDSVGYTVESDTFSGSPIETANIPTIAIRALPNSVQTVVINDGEYIGSGAFGGCYNLTSITIPNSVKKIMREAFSGCRSLTSITIPNSVRYIGDGAFSRCDNLTSIEIPNSVEKIMGEAFYGCISLTSITIPNSVTIIGANVFEKCRSLTIYCEAEEAPNDWDSNWNAGIPVVWDCHNNDKDADGYSYSVIDGIRYSLKGGEATIIKQPHYSAIKQRHNILVIPSSVTYMNEEYSVTSIVSGAFGGFYNLTSIEIPHSVTSIGDGAFRSCTGLTSITISNSVTSIGDSAFDGCSELTSVYYKGTKSEWNTMTIGSNNYELNSTMKYYYSETQPTETGKYWHYVNDMPTVW